MISAFAAELPGPSSWNAGFACSESAFHSERLAGFGVTNIDARSYDVNERLSVITRGLSA